MFIKLTKTDGTPVWLNPEFIVRIEPWKKGSAVAAAILKKNRCRSRKRIENTIKSMNPKMSMADARALLQQMEARGLVLIDAQGHATFT